MEEGKTVESMEVRLQSGKLILVEADMLDEIWKLRKLLLCQPCFFPFPHDKTSDFTAVHFKIPPFRISKQRTDGC